VIGESPYNSPTDMGVNMAGYCIVDDEAVKEAAREEIIRRYYNIACNIRKGNDDPSEINKIEMVMENAKVTAADRKAAVAALDMAKATGKPAMAVELADGTIHCGKTSQLLGPASAMLLNALKHLARIPVEVDLISPIVLEPICSLMTDKLGHANPRLHLSEVLVALSICALTDMNARKALAQLDQLKGCEVHSSVIISAADVSTFRRLGVNLTCEPVYQSKNLYHGN
ncbi:MAG: DUF1846 family protein, partial [Bacteroidales bacterium]|nr:DUF1846 family protein [Bacteroidales bacterium]